MDSKIDPGAKKNECCSTGNPTQNAEKWEEEAKGSLLILEPKQRVVGTYNHFHTFHGLIQCVQTVNQSLHVNGINVML